MSNQSNNTSNEVRIQLPRFLCACAISLCTYALIALFADELHEFFNHWAGVIFKNKQEIDKALWKQIIGVILLTALIFLICSKQVVSSLRKLRLWSLHFWKSKLLTVTFISTSILFTASEGLNYFLLIGWGIATSITIYLWINKERPHTEATDVLGRRYFAEQLATHFSQKSFDFKRIAILGPWGSGKTHFLHLLKQHLTKQDARYKIALVNPWHAETPDQAWKIIATGFNEALGLLNTSKTSPSTSFINKIFKIIPSFDIGYSALKALTSSTPSDGRARIEEINQLIESSNYKIVILIDDMERAEPEVIRKLFPVIDKLTAFKNCSFIFAIDPQRIAKAFSTSKSSPEDHKAEAKGFMDKVFDMTILLPDANEQEITKLAKIWVNAKQFPRLHSSLDKFPLPTNPRDLQRYLTKAKYIEALFFTNRYEDNEKNFDIVYLICLAESIYPGFIDALRDAPIKTKVEDLLDHNRLDHVLEANDVNISTIESIVTLIKEKCSTTNNNITLEQIIRSLASLNSYSVGYAPTPKTSIDWVTGGYTQRYLITDTERSGVMEKFSKAKGKTTILELMPAEVLRKEESTAAFLLFYIDSILDAIKSRSRKDERKHLIQSINHLDSYLMSSGEAHKFQALLDSRINAWITTGVFLEEEIEAAFLTTTRSFIQFISTRSLNQQLIGLFHSGHDIHLHHTNIIGQKVNFLKEVKNSLAKEATSLLLRIFSSDDYYKDYYTAFREPDVMTLFLRGHPYWTDVEKFSKLLTNSNIQSEVAYDYADSLLNGWDKFDGSVDDFYELLKSKRNPDTLLRLIKHLFQAANEDLKFSLSAKARKSLDAIESPDLAAWFTAIFDDFLQHTE